ncbi:MAG: hypothetical protein HZA01_16735 [Nitrospinae bacterium]|nr:hypothetical protein [Nitrospinota bacterium]
MNSRITRIYKNKKNVFIDPYKSASSAFYLFLFFLALFLPGCRQAVSPQYMKEGKEYGTTRGLFRDRWWNYYERGCSFLAGGFLEEAERDLRQAIALRDKDARMARTYGLHFIDYFPHRDLAVVLYHQGRFEEGEKEILLSLAQAESGKAKFYANLMRKALIARNEKDTTSPAIHIAAKETRSLTNNPVFQLNGAVEDAGYVSGVRINGERVFMELAEKSYSFQKSLFLVKGNNRISIEVEDLSGNKAEKSLDVFLDREGPVVSIVDQEEGEEPGGKILTIRLADSSPVVFVSGLETDGKSRELIFKKQLRQNEALEIKARDILGNESRAEVRPLLAGLAEPALLAMNMEPAPGMLAGLFSTEDTAPPRIRLEGMEENVPVYAEDYYLQGSVADSGKVKFVEINGESLNVKPALELFFNYIVRLKEGENRISVKAGDALGNVVEKEFIVTRNPQKARSVGSRLALSVLPFQEKSGQAELSPRSYDMMLNALMDSRRFKIVSRGKELDAVLKEVGLSRTDLVDPDSAVRIGKITAAEAILAGAISESPESVEIFARIIDTETSEVLAAEDVFTTDKSMKGLDYICRGLAAKFMEKIPLAEGMVVRANGKELTLDLGLRSNIRENSRALIYREGEPVIQPLTGKKLGADAVILAEGKITGVLEAYSKGEIVKHLKSGEIKAGDLVIMK